MSPPTALPIDPLLPELVSTLRGARSLVLEAPPGAGKTTRVPPALLDAGLAGDKEIWVLQPRRLATRLAAQRVASERGEKTGATVGYQVRFEDVTGPQTRIRFVTEGILRRRLLDDRALSTAGVVVLDEFHERHLDGDLALAQLRLLQQKERPDLKLVVMSATLEAEPVAAYLGGCPRLRSEGRRFDVALEHLETPDDRYLDQQVLAAMKRVVAAQSDGDVLVFLPGAAEIRRAREACEELAGRHGIEVHALHGDLPPAEQDRAVRPSSRRKLILSTNVAETSVTIEGVAVVIDSGVARVASHSPWSGLASLQVSKISRASATQRAGRAGRTRAGRCLRLFTRHDFDSRPEHEAPEIRRLDLTEMALALRASGVPDLGSYPYFEPPPRAALDAAETLLRDLGAVGADREVTELGRRLLRFPVHPRLGRLLAEAERRGVADDGAVVAALAGERDLRLESRAKLRAGEATSAGTSGPSDLLEMLERFREAERAQFSAGAAKRLGVDLGAAQAVSRAARQLARAFKSRGAAPPTEAKRDEALLLSILAAFPDRLAKRRKPKSPEVVLAGGGSATLSEASVVRDAEFLVAVEAEERPRGGAVVRIASEVSPEALLELFPESISDSDALEWNAEVERVERVTRLSYRGLALEETRAMAAPSEAAARILADAAVAAGPARFIDAEALEQWLARVHSVASAFPEAGLPTVDDGFLRSALAAACVDLRSFAELKDANLLDRLSASLTPEQQRLLVVNAPERVSLPGGRAVRVHYERTKPPWIESRLQDFFGMARGPSLGGRAPLVLHLLAPNQRAVQVTTDLAGFWERHYPAIRKKLMRKYPRHSWPEDPLHAAPPAPRPPRR